MKSKEDEKSSGGNQGAEEHQEMPPEEMEHHLSCVQNAQPSGTEEQLGDSRTAATSGPSAASRTSDLNSIDTEAFFRKLSSCQSQRMDDQRVSLSMLPGMQIFSSKGSALMNQWESDQLCKFIIRSQSSRMEDQRCTLPQIILTPETPEAQRRSCSRPASPTHRADPLTRPPPRSASFSPTTESQRTELNNNVQTPTLSPAEQERLLSMVCQALRGRMEDQRCYLDPSMRRTQSAQGLESILNGVDPEHFFKMVCKIQSNRLDDQRVALSFLPGIQTPSGDVQKPLSAETDRMYNLISTVQSNRMDEQRCYAPHIQLGTPAPTRKVWDGNGPPMQNLLGPGSSKKAVRRSSAPVGSSSETNEQQNNGIHTAQMPVSADQEKFLSMVCQAKRWMNNERHAYDSDAQTTDQFFALVANSQSKRMDDQRATMPVVNTEKPLIPQIILTPGSPAAPRRASPRPTSLIQDQDLLPRPPPRSASFSPVSDKERTQLDNVSTKLTFQVSVCLNAPNQGSNSDGQQGPSSDVFLTIGTPGGENFVLPLTPMVCAPPYREMTPRPRRHRSRSPSPYRAHGRTAHPKPSSAKPAPNPQPIGTEEDYFSLIHRVHSAQLQQGNAAERSREPGKGRERGDGRRERKDRVKRK